MHIPVLLHETVSLLNPKEGNVVLDGTAGAGGHAKALAEHIGASGTIILIDREKSALIRAENALKDLSCSKIFIEGDFKDMEEYKERYKFAAPNAILLDIGISSFQLDVSGRGFSFLRNEPLLMTMKENPSGDDITAKEIVNTWSEETLADIIFGFGEERYARRIAKAIVEDREAKPFETTLDLVETIKRVVPASYTRGKIHPATRTFQALRIAVNTELTSLETAIVSAWKILAPGGRIGIISFHSLEDRIIKRAFQEIESNGEGYRVNKKPIVPTDEEKALNPRARSSKLRVLEKNI